MTTTTADNGVNVEALLGAREAITENPELGQFTWRATNTWLKGTHSRGEVEGFYGLSDEQSHTKKFVFDADHPLQFAAEDNGATPAEIVLVALGGCLTGGVASVAQQRGIQLQSVKATIEADHDLRGILGADPEVPSRFNAVRVRYEIDADASTEDVQALVAQSQKRSAVFDLLTNPTAVTVDVHTA
ncbi:MAG: OsmC family protein [Nocardioides sp.]|jgi:uncharacterized OsmC-like protein